MVLGSTRGFNPCSHFLWIMDRLWWMTTKLVGFTGMSNISKKWKTTDIHGRREKKFTASFARNGGHMWRAPAGTAGGKGDINE